MPKQGQRAETRTTTTTTTTRTRGETRGLDGWRTPPDPQTAWGSILGVIIALKTGLHLTKRRTTSSHNN